MNYSLGYNALQYICSRYLLGFGEVSYYLGYNALQYIYPRYLLGFGEVNYSLGYNALQDSLSTMSMKPNL